MIEPERTVETALGARDRFRYPDRSGPETEMRGGPNDAEVLHGAVRKTLRAFRDCAERYSREVSETDG